jgi:hypothetical protein
MAPTYYPADAPGRPHVGGSFTTTLSYGPGTRFLTHACILTPALPFAAIIPNGPGPCARGLRSSSCYHPCEPRLSGSGFKFGRYTVSLLTVMEIVLFGLALVVFLIGVLVILRGR